MAKSILVLSDSHGNSRNVKKILELCPDADMIVHLGDGACDFTKFLPDNYDKPFVVIEGNGEYYGWVDADRRYRPKRTETIEFEGKKIFMTHGHLYDVKYGLERIAARAYADGADIVLFGHTHEPFNSYKDGVYYFNPGSIREGFYGVIDITEKGIMCLNKNLVSY